MQMKFYSPLTADFFPNEPDYEDEFYDSYQKALNIVSEYVETELSPSPTPKRDRGDAR